MFYLKFPGVPCLYRAGFDVSPAALSVANEELSSRELLLGVVLDV